jgi:release factor glutamine methyltransferase
VTESWTVRRIAAWMQADFTRRGIESARLDADLLLAHALGLKRIALYLDPERPLDERELAAVRALVERRRKREPIAYILGEREFYGRRFEVSADVLVPRPDTETLVESAKVFLAGDAPEGALLDLCTGSGAVAVTLAAECPDRSVVGSDISRPALAVAQKNVAQHGLEARVELRLGDLFAVCREGEHFACITVNPPYIATVEIETLAPDVRDFEPRLALDAGADALAFYRRLAREAPARLVAGGALLVEVGIHQADAVAALFRESKLVEVGSARDLNGVARVVSGRLPHA